MKNIHIECLIFLIGTCLSSCIHPNNLSSDSDIITFSSVNITDYSTNEVNTNGSVIFNNYDESSLYTIELYSGRKTTIATDVSYLSSITSPDGSNLTYQSTTKDEIIIISANGEEIRSFDFLDNAQLAYWLDNKYLAFDYMHELENAAFQLSSLMIYDLNTNKYSEYLPENYPSIYDCCEFTGKDWATHSFLSLSPDQKYLIYLARTEDVGLSLVLWDIKENKEITTIHHVDTRSTPWWSPSGNQIVTSIYIEKGSSDLFSVDTKGNISRLTYYTSNYVSNQVNYTWAPSGNKIAFLLQLSEKDSKTPDRDWKLAIFDISTNRTTVYKLDGINDLSKPVWSCDEQFIAIKAIYSSFSTYVLNIHNGNAYQLSEKDELVGWGCQRNQ